MNILLLELNEFNEDLLKKAAKELNLKNIQHFLNFHKSKTWTDDTYESTFLEPWVQWVSIHTGMPSAQHQIKHLGDAPESKIIQIWEKLSEQGISSGIWGAMNARRNLTENCLFFLPDPWMVLEDGFPNELNSLLRPLQYISKNYTNCSLRALMKQVYNLLNLFKKNQLIKILIKEFFLLAKDLIIHKAKPFVFVSFLDFFSALLFLKYKKKFNPTFSLLFLNSIAHLQHHQWNDCKIITPSLKHGFKNIDRVLGHIYRNMQSNDTLIVTNALAQKNTNDEKPWILYRQIDQKKFLSAIGINDVVVESHMTHDAHLFFSSIKSAQKAYETLSSVTIGDDLLFYVESYSDDPLKIFYRIQFTDPLLKDASLKVQGKIYHFFDFFKVIVKRTGRHVQNGTLFCNKPFFPNEMLNHEIYNKITDIFIK